MNLENLDDALRALTVHDATRNSIERTRARCLARLRPSRGTRRLAWLEPIAAVSLSALYLASALQAATLLLYLR